MKDLEKTQQLFAAAKEKLLEDEQHLQEETKKQYKKAHLLAELEELEIDEIAWEEIFHELIREDVALEAENERKQVEQEQQYWHEKNNHPSWIADAMNETQIGLKEFNSESFDEENFINSLKQLPDIKNITAQGGKYQLTLDNGKKLQFDPAQKNIIINDFSDKTLKMVACVAHLCGSNQFDLTHLLQNQRANVNQNQIDHIHNMLQSPDVKTTFKELPDPEDVSENKSSISRKF